MATLALHGTFTIGMREFIALANGTGVGVFIFQALDKGCTVKISNCIQVKFRTWEIITHNKPDATVSFIRNHNIIFCTPLKGFSWFDVEMCGCDLWYKNKHVKTT